MGFNGIWPMKKWGSQNQHSWSQALFFSHWVLTCFARHKCNNQALRSLLIGTKDIPRSMLNVGTWKPHELNVEILQSIEIPHTQFVLIILGLEIQNLMCDISGTIGRCFPLYPSYHHLSRRSWNPPSKSSPKCSQTLDAPGWIPHSSNQKISKHPHKNYHGGAYWGMGFYLPKNPKKVFETPHPWPLSNCSIVTCTSTKTGRAAWKVSAGTATDQNPIGCESKSSHPLAFNNPLVYKRYQV